MTAFRYRSVLLAGLLPALAAVSAVAAPAPGATPTPASPPATDPLETLMKDSPFMPQASGSSTAGQNGPLEFRGVIMERGSYSFSLFDQGAKQSYWVGLNEPGLPFVVRSYDRTSDTVTVEQRGRTLALTLAAARTIPVNPAMAPQPAPGAPAGQPGQPPGTAAGGQVQPLPGSISPNGITPDEAQRLQRIADEIRRRRAVGKAAPTPPPKP